MVPIKIVSSLWGIVSYIRNITLLGSATKKTMFTLGMKAREASPFVSPILNIVKSL